MWYFFPGFLAGAVAALLLFAPVTAVEVSPEWQCGIKNTATLEQSPHYKESKARFFVKINDQDYVILKGNGGTHVSGAVSAGIAAFSGDGMFYAKCQKVGTSVEFFNARGDRFWKLESMEYPYLSYAGRLIFLLNGDQTAVRVVDYNGNILGAGLAGMLCTVISFSDRSDYGGIGFLDGSYYFVNAKGMVIGKGMTPLGTAVKGIAVSGNGRFGAVHYGSTRKDYLRVMQIGSDDFDEVELAHVHPVKTSIHVSEEGFSTIIDVDRILYVSSGGSVKMNLAIPAKRYGHSAISLQDGIYAVSYTMKKGSSRVLLYRENGTVLFSKDFPAEAFLDVVLRNGLIFLRGSDNIFCYGLHGV